MDVALEVVCPGLRWCRKGVVGRRRAGDDIAHKDPLRPEGAVVDREVVRDAVIFVVEVHRHVRPRRHRDGEGNADRPLVLGIMILYMPIARLVGKVVFSRPYCWEKNFVSMVNVLFSILV